MKRQRIYPTLLVWRREEGLTQKAAAQFLEVSQGFLSKIERGTAFPDRRKAKVISERAGVPLAAVLGVVDLEPPAEAGPAQPTEAK
jgi:transcriptional regulator with XRE-family HTH domain